MSDTQWKARIYVDKAVKGKVFEDIKTIAYALMDGGTLSIERGDFDPYTYCKHETKKYCPLSHKRKYRGYLRPGGYVFHGNTELEIYLEVIRALAGDQVYFPLYRLEKRKGDADE